MEYVMKFTEPELDLIMRALGELPAKMSLNLMNKFRNEIIAQNQKLEKMEKPKPPEPRVKIQK